MSFSTIVIFGCSGYLGQFLWKHFQELKKRGELPANSVIGTYLNNPLPQCKDHMFTQQRLNFTVDAEILSFLEGLPSGRTLFVNVSALSIIRLNESNPTLASQLNAPYALIKSISEDQKLKDSIFIHLSTEHVFSGERKPCGRFNMYQEDDEVVPLHVYGKSKVECEEYLRELLPNRHFIFRSSVMLGPPPPISNKAHSSFIQVLDTEIMKALAAGGSPRYQCFEDENRTFVYVMDVVTVISRLTTLLSQKHTFEHSVYHLGGKDVSTRYDLAKIVCKRRGIPYEQVLEPISQTDLYLGFPRPHDLTMDTSRLKSTFQMELTSLSDVVRNTIPV